MEHCIYNLHCIKSIIEEHNERNTFIFRDISGAISVVTGIVAGIILHFKRKMLEIKLDEEYGKKMK